MKNENVTNAVQAIEKMVNTFGDTSEQFIDETSRLHRTLQNSFTKVALSWIEYVASDAYRTDPRNMSSHLVCAEMLKAFRDHQISAGYTGSSLEIMSKPSGYCQMI